MSFCSCNSMFDIFWYMFKHLLSSERQIFTSYLVFVMIKGLKAARWMRVKHLDSMACVNLGLIIFPFPMLQHTFLTHPVTQVLLSLLTEVTFVSATVSFGLLQGRKGWEISVGSYRHRSSVSFVQSLLLLFWNTL